MTHRLISEAGELLLYGFVGPSWWDADAFFSDLDVIEALGQIEGDVTVRVNSSGGNAYMGLAIRRAFAAHNGRVTCYVDALAASAASVFAMGADEIIMATGAMMMIHNPSSFSFGEAHDHRAEADALDKLAASSAQVYAARTGRPAAEMLAIMDAETWLIADEAVSEGFADRVEGDEAAAGDDAGAAAIMAVPAFDYSLYRRTPAAVLSAAPSLRHATRDPATIRAALLSPAGLMPAQPRSPQMANKTHDAPDGGAQNPGRNQPDTPQQTGTGPTPDQQSAPPAPAPAPALNAEAIYQRAADAGLTIAEANAIMQVKPASNEAAFSAIIDKVAEKNERPEPQQRVNVTADERERFQTGAERAVLARIGGFEEGERNEFASMTLCELARMSLDMAGHKSIGFGSRIEMVGAAFNPMMAGMGSTSDFPLILENIAEKSLLKGYNEAEETFDKWTGRGSMSDFKTQKRVDTGAFPNLAEVPEGGEYTYATVGERGVEIMLATYGKLFKITRQTIINDDLAALSRTPGKMGRAAKRTVGQLVAAVILENQSFQGKALFHSTRGNLAANGAAPSVATFEAAETAMMDQRDDVSEKKDRETLGITPRYVISGTRPKHRIRQLLRSSADPDAQHEGVPNTVQGLVEHIIEPRFRDGRYLFAADPSQADTLEVTYLDGRDEPHLESRMGWNVDGTEWKVRLDAGVNPLDFRGLYLNPGEAVA